MLKIPALILTVLGLAGVATSARAETGFEAALRLGYGVPLGGVTEDGGDLSDSASGQAPIWIDLGYRVIDPLFVGAYFQYGFGILGTQFDDACDLEIECSASDVRLGVQAHYHLATTHMLDPWVGLGFGYEWLAINIEGELFEVEDGTTVNSYEFEFDGMMSGLEYLDLQAGLDVDVSEQVKVGPFVSFSLGRYHSVSADCSGPPDVCSPLGLSDPDVGEKTTHEWLMFGVRGVYLP